MKKIVPYLLFSLILSGFHQTTQAQLQDVISSQGDSYTTSSIVLDYSIGEVVIQTVGSSGVELTQGFHQPTSKASGLNDLNSDLQMNVFPNPAFDYLTLITPDTPDAKYVLYDAIGKIVAQESFFSKETTVNLNGLQSGVYLLKIVDMNNELLKSFKVIKQ